MRQNKLCKPMLESLALVCFLRDLLKPLSFPLNYEFLGVTEIARVLVTDALRYIDMIVGAEKAEGVISRWFSNSSQKTCSSPGPRQVTRLDLIPDFFSQNSGFLPRLEDQSLRRLGWVKTMPSMPSA